MSETKIRIRRNIEILRGGYARRLPSKVADLESRFEGLLTEEDLSVEAWAEAGRIAHGLVGSSGLHRFPEVRDAAMVLESIAQGVAERVVVVSDGLSELVAEAFRNLKNLSEAACLEFSDAGAFGVPTSLFRKGAAK